MWTATSGRKGASFAEDAGWSDCWLLFPSVSCTGLAVQAVRSLFVSSTCRQIQDTDPEWYEKFSDRRRWMTMVKRYLTTNDPSRAPKVRKIDRAARPCPVALSRNELSKLRESYWREVQSLRQQLYQKQQAEAEKDWYSPSKARESAVFGGSMLIWSCFRRFFCLLMVLDWL